MSKQIYPISLPYAGFTYDDDAARPSTLDVSHLESSFQLSDWLKQAGHHEASELCRPIRLLSGFHPAALIERMHEVERASGGRAGIAFFRSNREPDVLWSPAPNGVNELVRICLSGGFVVGIICLNPDGSFTTYTEPAEDQTFRTLVLNGIARSCQDHPSWIAAAQILALDRPENFERSNIEHTLDRLTAITEKYPQPNIHDEITVAKEAI